MKISKNIYDKSNLKYAHNLVSPTIVDIGANVGIESMKLFYEYPDSQIILVEPQEENCKIIKKYIEDKKLENQWTIMNCAVDLTDGFKEFGFHPFALPPEKDGSVRLNGALDSFNWEKWHYTGTKLVETKQFNRICTNPNIIKIDIERHEYVVLPDICKNNFIEIMYIELHGPCYDLDIFKYFENILSGTDLEITSWWEIKQNQTYSGPHGQDDFCKEIMPQQNIECDENRDIIIERIKI